MFKESTHIAYSDECQFNVGRFRGIGLVTVASSDEPRLHQEMTALMVDSKASELKWEKVRNAKYRFAALKAITCAIRLTQANIIRIDVLVWDTWDQRHNVQGRDDVQNLQRMYYHLFRNVLVNRWPSESTWRLFPDEHSGIDWQNMEDVLDNSSSCLEAEYNLFTRGRSDIRLRRDFRIIEIVPAFFHQTPGVQLADLFAGLAVYSRASYDTFELSRPQRDQQQFLMLENEPVCLMSNADVERCRVLDEFDGVCKNNKLGVSLRTHRGLRTLNPEYPINFWWYEPQREDDKAPTRRD